jgi:two-component system OmpR family response regulator
VRILFIPCPHPESAWLFKAFQESAHSLQRADDLPDGIVLATHETFDAIVATALDPCSHAALLEGLGPLSAAAGAAAVVTVVGQSSPAERAHVLRSGAHACFCQPYSFIELHERLHAFHRAGRTRGAQTKQAKRGLQLDPTTRELVAGNTRLLVTRREYLLLECLMRQFDAPVPRDHLIRYAWPETEYVDPSSVNLVVSRLRRKLAVRLPRVQIETVSRYGYQIAVDQSAR